MGFWSRIIRQKKSSSERKKREDKDLKKLLIEEKEKEKQEKIKAQEEAAKKEAERKTREEAERKAREEAAIREQERLAEANRKASEAKRIINTSKPKQKTSTTKSIMRVNNTTSNIQPESENTNNHEEEKDKVIEYIDPLTGKVYILRQGQKPPQGTVLKSNYKPQNFNSAKLSIQKAAQRAEKLVNGKTALAPSTKQSQWQDVAGTGKLAKSAANLNNDTNMFFTQSLGTENIGPKTALAPSTKQSQWQDVAGTGKLAKSAAKVELSNVINVDPTKLTTEQKEKFKKEQAWKNMSYEEKTQARNTLPDKDGDLVPDVYDCEPDDYTKQGYADIYMGGKYALGPSRKMQRNIITGKGRLQMAKSMKSPNKIIKSTVAEAKVGNILNLTSKGFSAGRNPLINSKNINNKNKNVMNKIMGPSKSNKSTIVKSKSNKNFQVNMSKNFKQKFDVNVINKKKFGLKAASKKGMQKPIADKVFKKMSKKYGF